MLCRGSGTVLARVILGGKRGSLGWKKPAGLSHVWLFVLPAWQVPLGWVLVLSLPPAPWVGSGSAGALLAPNVLLQQLIPLRLLQSSRPSCVCGVFKSPSIELQLCGGRLPVSPHNEGGHLVEMATRGTY